MQEQFKYNQLEQSVQATQPVAVQEADDAGMTIDLMELFFRLLASWKLIAALALVFAVGAGVYTQYFVTDMYRATATIYVVSRTDSVINMSDLQLGSALTNDYIKLFKTWEMHEEVASNLDLPYSYSNLRSMLSVSNESGTRMLDLTVTSPKPEEAALLANEYARVSCDYIARTMSSDKPNIVSTALVPTYPVSPNRSRNIMLGFILGVAIAAGLVTLNMLLDDKYKTAEDIRRYTGLATIAMVPVEPGVAKEKHRRR